MSTDADSAQVRVVVGRVGRPNGVRGSVFVLPLTDEPELRFEPGALLFAGPPADRELVVDELRFHNGKMIVTFMDSRSREDAESLRHSVLEVNVAAAESPEDPDEYYDRQLHGLRVVDPAGIEVGTVLTVLHLPSQDVLEVRLADGPIRLIPFVKQIASDVDLALGTVTVDAPAGLLEGDDLDGGE
ncbi:MAG: ribosome maturation factor RimM [Actinobacteria bacterium]|nr:ribosome maturation factor RimM [Actinomycetota bacterium]